MAYSIIVTFYQNINMLWNCICVLMNTICSDEDVEVVLVNDNPTIDLKSEFAEKQFPVPLRVVQMCKTMDTLVLVRWVSKTAMADI